MPIAINRDDAPLRVLNSIIISPTDSQARTTYRTLRINTLLQLNTVDEASESNNESNETR